MEPNPAPAGRAPATTGRKVVTVLIVLFVGVALVLAARFLVSTVNIVDLLKSLHGG